jgi:hypothetical protein
MSRRTFRAISIRDPLFAEQKAGLFCDLRRRTLERPRRVRASGAPEGRFVGGRGPIGEARGPREPTQVLAASHAARYQLVPSGEGWRDPDRGPTCFTSETIDS